MSFKAVIGLGAFVVWTVFACDGSGGGDSDGSGQDTGAGGEGGEFGDAGDGGSSGASAMCALTQGQCPQVPGDCCTPVTGQVYDPSAECLTSGTPEILDCHSACKTSAALECYSRETPLGTEIILSPVQYDVEALEPTGFTVCGDALRDEVLTADNCQ